MRGYESKNEYLHLKVYEFLCATEVFTVNGKPADKDDFGDQEDVLDGYDYVDSEYANDPGGCHCMTFAPKPPTQKILDKYGINVDQYNYIASELGTGLSFGSCALCL